MSNNNGRPAHLPGQRDIAAVAVREATASDTRRLRRLAYLDSAPVPDAPVLVAEVDGEMRAAISLADGAAIADPFHPTAELVAILRMRAGIRAERPHRLPTLRNRRRDQAPRPSAPGVPGVPVVPSHTL